MLIPYSFLPLGAALIFTVVLAATLLRREGDLATAETVAKPSILVRKALSVLLFFVFGVGRLMRDDAVYKQYGLDAEGALLPAGDMAVTSFIFWFELLTVAMAILVPFFDKRELHDYVTFFGPFAVVLSSLYLEQFFTVTVANTSPVYWRNVLFMVELFLIAAISFSELFLLFRTKNLRGGARRIRGDLAFILTYFIPFMPAWLPGVFLGATGGDPTGFSLTHRLLLYLGIFILFYFYLAYRNKSSNERLFALIALSLSGFFNYFSVDRSGLSGLPLHLCNTAIVMMFITFVFRLKGLFYFTYLVNVLGALFAILMPNTEALVTEPSSIIFWFNHLYAFAIPILGVALAIFPKPNFKMVLKAIGVFTIYFVAILFIDGWFNNAPFNTEGKLIDYFFVYSGFYADKFPFVLPLYKIEWRILNDLGETVILLRPVYQLAIYVIFIVSMFILWGIYASLFRVADDHKELARKKKALQADHLRLLAELGNRPLSEPLNPEGKDMIKIEHFTKIYNGSTRKSADDINLEIHAGEVFGFIGHNGAGKSTTIKSLVGIQSITEGRIEVEGYDITRQPMEAKMHIGYVSDNHAVYEKLTGREYVYYVADLYRVSQADREARLDKYVKMFHLEEAIDREIKGYSHGMKQKIMVISALIHNPKVWVLDEPLTGLDPTSAYQIKQCMREHANEGNIVFFSSHIIEVVERICDRIAIISGGKICQHSTMDEIRASGKSLEEIYLQYIDGPEGALLAKERAKQAAEQAAKRAAEAAE